MKKVFVLVVALLMLATAALGHKVEVKPTWHGDDQSCMRECRDKQHDQQAVCIDKFNDAYQECKERFHCGTSRFRECGQRAYDEKQECMDKTDMFYERCVGNR